MPSVICIDAKLQWVPSQSSAKKIDTVEKVQVPSEQSMLSKFKCWVRHNYSKCRASTLSSVE